jgi:prolipoprotein diacylglyceryl transferase
MDPIAFHLFGIPIRWYGLLIASAVIIGTMLALKETKRKGLEEETFIDLLLYAIPAAIIGARIYYVIFSWDLYRDNPIEAFNIRAGGLAIHGVIIGAVIALIIFSKFKKQNPWILADIAAPSLILGQAIGRWGNFANQEAHGGPTDLPWGILVNGVKVHPTFLYESIWNLMVFFFLLWFNKNKAKENGEVFILYLVLYSVARLFIEGLRTDSLMWGPIRVAQLISLAIIIVGSYLFYKRRKQWEIRE